MNVRSVDPFRQEGRTPRHILDALARVAGRPGRPFDLDLCARFSNAVCPRYIAAPDDDADPNAWNPHFPVRRYNAGDVLREVWRDVMTAPLGVLMNDEMEAFGNPPFGAIKPFQAALEREIRTCPWLKITVIVPASIEAAWFFRFRRLGFREIRFAGRVAYDPPPLVQYSQPRFASIALRHDRARWREPLPCLDARTGEVVLFP